MMLDKPRLLKTLTSFGYREEDVEKVLSEIDDHQMTEALLLILGLRRDVMRLGISPAVTRAALKFALIADARALREANHEREEKREGP